MSAILTILMLVILLACVAMCYAEGMWSNAVRLINIVTAGLLAMNFFEPLARWLTDWQPSYTYLWDFLSLWGLFVVFMLVFRILTDQLSHVKVRFLKLADRIGSGVLSLWIGWVMVCFTMTTLHTAPLAKVFMWEGFQPEEKMFFGLAPDHQWLAFTQKMSMGTFSCSSENVFDPDSEFIPKYERRRADLEEQIDKSNTLLKGQ
jgi:uncharacterized membrane protein required for colicin V production